VNPGWSSRKLGEICSIELGKTPARDNPRYWDLERTTGNVWLSIADLLNAEDGVINDSKEYISDAGAALCKKVRKGTLLVSFKLTLGRMAVAGDDLFTNEAIAALALRDDAGITQKSLYYALTFFDWEKATDGDQKIKGRTMNKAKLKEIDVAFPNFSEQHRIFTILDEAFEGIAIAKANAKKNLQNVGMLLEQSLTAIFDHGRCGDAPKHSLGSLATFRNGLNFSKHSKGQSVRIVGVKDFQKNFSVPVEGLESITMDGFLSEADRVAEGDIVFVRSNGNPELIGRCMLVGSLDAPTTHSGFTIKMRLHSDLVSATYACHFLKSPAVRKQLVAGGNGANIKSLNQGTLSSVVIPLPSKEVQELVVADIEQLTEEAERLASVYLRKLTALDELKKSLLHQAFSGQL